MVVAPNGVERDRAAARSVVGRVRHVYALVHLAIAVAATACARLPAEGEVCTDWTCAAGLACVPDVGAEYGAAATDDVCEKPRAIYSMMAYGERGENRRVDEALDMIDGTFRLPRFAATDPSLATISRSVTLADGTSLSCTGLRRGNPVSCQVPDWKRYFGAELEKYDRFIFFGLRTVSSLVYTAYYAPANRLAVRYHALTGKGLDSAGIAWLRTEARNLALAIIDSFIAEAHQPFALEQMPACYAGTSGYQNPNAAWAPALAHWDPAMRLDNGRLRVATDVPADCSGALSYTYDDLRDSLWYKHGVAFRAIALANAYFLFRGLLSTERRELWLRAIRDTGNALALPSSYEPEQNHGITESAALVQLGYDFASLLPSEVTTAWLKLGRYRLNDIIVDTVFSDGVQVEQSPMYHNYQAALLLAILTWMEDRDLDVVTEIGVGAPVDHDTVAPAPDDPAVTGLNASPTLDARAVVDRMIRASVHITQPDGQIPMIGSSVPQQLRGYQDDVFQRYIDEPHPNASLLRFFLSAGKKGTPPPDSAHLTVFEDSGFVTMHSAFKPDFTKQTHVVFNTGVPYNRHSHPDVLSVHLFGPDTTPGSSAGTPLLVDSGWFSYEAVGAHFFKSTLAHNTVNVDGTNQCVRDPANMRQEPYTEGALLGCARLGELRAGAGVVQRGMSLTGNWNGQSWLYQSAGHTLYLGTTHRRAVLLVGRDILIVVDMLASDAPRTFSQTWHLAPRIPEQTESVAGGDGSHHLQFARGAGNPEPLMSLHEATEGAELALHYGAPPVAGVYGQGWYSRQENEAEPNVVVEFRRTGVTTTAFASVFMLGARAGQRPEVTLRRDNTWSFTLTVKLRDDRSLALELENLAETGAEVVRVR